LPVEVSSWDVIPQVKTVSVQVPNGSGTAEKLYLQIHNIRFGGQVSVSVNGGRWKHLFNHNVELYELDQFFQGIGGIFATVRMDVPLEKGEVRNGRSNTVSFRLNGTNGETTAIRVLDFNFKNASGNHMVRASQFSQENPDQWSPPRTSNADINAGRNLWSNGALVDNSVSQKPILANCSSCHFEDGSDLKYFNYSNETIINRARFHGLSATEGEQIASYIRTRGGLVSWGGD